MYYPRVFGGLFLTGVFPWLDCGISSIYRTENWFEIVARINKCKNLMGFINEPTWAVEAIAFGLSISTLWSIVSTRYFDCDSLCNDEVRSMFESSFNEYWNSSRQKCMTETDSNQGSKSRKYSCTIIWAIFLSDFFLKRVCGIFLKKVVKMTLFGEFWL